MTLTKSLFFPWDQLPGAGAGAAIFALAQVSLEQTCIGYAACAERCHLWWIPLDFNVWNQKGMQTGHLFFKLTFGGSIMSKHSNSAGTVFESLCVIKLRTFRKARKKILPEKLLDSECHWKSQCLPASEEHSYSLTRNSVSAFTVARGKDQRKKESFGFLFHGFC